MKSRGITKVITVTFKQKWAQTQGTHRGGQVRDQKATEKPEVIEKEAKENTKEKPENHKEQIRNTRTGEESQETHGWKQTNQ